MMILLTGGSACGKSTYAELLATRAQMPRYYIAAMRPYGDESLAKIARHRRMRQDKGFATIERYTDLEHLQLPARGTVLLECMSNLTANEIFSPEGAGKGTYEAVCRGLLRLKEHADHVCVVTNEIFSDGISYDMETQNYQRVLGKLNAFLAEISDACYEVVYGIPLRLR